MSVPAWYPLLLLALAAFRVWKLLWDDEILRRPRRWLLRMGKWEKEGDPIPPGIRRKLGDFLGCPWCFGFWIGLAWWGAWQAWPHATLVAAVPFAISALVGIVQTVLPDR